MQKSLSQRFGERIPPAAGVGVETEQARIPGQAVMEQAGLRRW